MSETISDKENSFDFGLPDNRYTIDTSLGKGVIKVWKRFLPETKVESEFTIAQKPDDEAYRQSVVAIMSESIRVLEGLHTTAGDIGCTALRQELAQTHISDMRQDIQKQNELHATKLKP